MRTTAVLLFAHVGGFLGGVAYGMDGLQPGLVAVAALASTVAFVLAYRAWEWGQR